MSRAKVLISILIVSILIVLSGVSVWAAPGESDPIAAPTEEPTAEPTEEPTAEPTEEPTAEPTEEPTAEPTEEPTAEPTEEPTAVHPVASALAEFFAGTLGLDYEMVMGYHEDGMGFGVIAQACWMSFALDGDAELLDDILEAKKSHNFGSIELPEGETATNWGQFKKAVLGSEKAHKNLGAIMSGRAAGEHEQEEDEEEDVVVGSSTELSGKGKDEDKGGGPPAEPPGKGKDKGGKPDTPPGQEKNKDKGKGGGKEK